MPRHLPLILILLCTAAITFIARVAGPSDLTEKTQPKTIAYTADMVVNGRWILPRHVDGEPATKPPLYNWFSAGVVLATGRWDEWVLKTPTMAAWVVTIALCAWMTGWMWETSKRRNVKTSKDDDAPRHFDALTFRRFDVCALATLILIACHPMFKHIYIARPDMLMTAFLIGAWVMGTVLLDRAARNDRGSANHLLALGMWVCIGGAALSKGPAALIPILYLPLAAQLIYGRLSLVNATGWWWGLPLAVAMFAAWAWPAYRINAQHFTEVVVAGETIDRITGGPEGGPLGIVLEFWKMPVYFLTRFGPWSLAVILALIWIPPRSWMRHPLAPAILWLLLSIVFFSMSSGKIARYLLPVYPAAAAIAASWLVTYGRHWRITPNRAAFAALLVTLGMCVAWWTTSYPATLSLGANNHAFAVEVRVHVHNNEPIYFRQCGSGIISTLLQRHPYTPADDVLANEDAAWMIADYTGQDDAIVISDPVEHGGTRIALFRRTG